MLELLKTLGGYLNQRFLVTAWLPSLLFWGAWAALLSARTGLLDAVEGWRRRPLEDQTALALAVLAGVTVFAYGVSSVSDALYRLYQGQWPTRLGRRLLARCKARYQEEHRLLSDDAPGSEAAQLEYLRTRTWAGETEGPDAVRDKCYAFVQAQFPPESMGEYVQPTRFGNLLINAQLYPWVRYEMDAQLVWSRLLVALPERLAQAVDAAKQAMDVSLTMSALGAIFALLGGAYAASVLPWYGFLLCFWGGSAIAAAGYSRALAAARSYGELTKTAFDLHRGTLLQALGASPPHSYGEERKRWRQFGNLWYRGVPEGAAGARELGYPPGEPERPPLPPDALKTSLHRLVTALIPLVGLLRGRWQSDADREE